MFQELTAGLAALLTAVVAVFGVNAWRRRLRDTTEYKVALHVLEALYEVLEATDRVRARHAVPADLTPEKFDEPASDAENESDVLAGADAYRAKLLRVVEANDHLKHVRQEAEALWGGKATNALAGIHEAVQTLYVTAEQYFGREVDRARRIERDDGSERPDLETQAMKRILYAMPDAKGKDPFAERIQRATRTAEAFYRGYLL